MSLTRQALPLERLIRYVKGVGPARAQQLATLGIRTVEDLLLHAPRRYEDRTRFASIKDLRPGEWTTLKVSVMARRYWRGRGGAPVVEALMRDATGTLQCLWFNMPYLLKQLAVGEELILYGKMESGPRPQMIHPELERLEDAEPDEAPIHMGRIVPVYPLGGGVTQRRVRRLAYRVLEELRATELATVEVGVSDILRPEPLLL